ncbi:MAG: hypothetical protein WA126_11620 [Thermodesulfovibrionales bacterium]
MKAIEIKAPAATVREFFLRPEIVLRLNPSWYVKDIKTADKDVYDITLYDDRTDEILQIVLTVEVQKNSINYRINSNVTGFFIHEASPSMTGLSIEGDFFRKEDIPYWLRGLKNYIQLEAGQSRIVKFLLDRFWLRMTPSQRRIALIIILAEGIGLAALAAVVLAIKLLK